MPVALPILSNSTRLRLHTGHENWAILTSYKFCLKTSPHSANVVKTTNDVQQMQQMQPDGGQSAAAVSTVPHNQQQITTTFRRKGGGSMPLRKRFQVNSMIRGTLYG
jgi:GTP cyclohydrolase FolE2